MLIEYAINNLYATYGKYGFSREFFVEQLQGGIDHGFSVTVAYNGLRMALGSEFGESELFTTEDIMEITGETKEELTERIEQYRKELAQMGLNPDDYFKPVQEKQTFYFPHGLTS